MESPEVIFLTEDGWWIKHHRDISGWWFRRVDKLVSDVRFSQLPEIQETYQPSSMIHQLARSAD